MRKHRISLVSFISSILFLVVPAALMQETSVAVPNLVGMNVPQAAAALNRVGLALGTQTHADWTAESGAPQNTIGMQSPAPDQPVSPGTSVDVTILRSPNVALVYDENDVTLINNTGSSLDLNGLSFGIVEGATPAAFAASRWTSALPAGGCAQLWSVLRSAPKDIEDCAEISRWLSSVHNTAEHFWTALNGVVTFSIVYDGVQYVTCPAAPAGAQPMRCETYIPAGSAPEITPYLYFVYTSERLIVFNRSQNQWMRLDATPVINLNPNVSVPEPQINLSDPTVVALVNPVATLSRLAPQQCLLFTNSVNPEQPNPPQPCDIVGQANIDPNLIFWSTSFDVVSVTDGRRRTCAAATPGRLTVCIMPR